MKKFLIACAFFIFASNASAFDNTALAQDLFARVNAERVKSNLPALVWNATLAGAAQAKANDLLAKSYFDHTSPEGKLFYIWIDETGYEYVMAGENLAMNQETISLETIITSWLNSPGHRANLLSDKFVESGMAVVTGQYQGRPVLFATQIFAIPKTLPEIKPLTVTAMPVKITAEIKKVEKPKSGSTKVSGATAATVMAPIATSTQHKRSLGTTRWQKIIQFIGALFR